MHPDHHYPALPLTPKSGDERFTSGSDSSGFDLRSFWQWSASDLISNATRGVLAEYIVAKALGVATGVRAEWDAYDLKMENGPTIEVKSAAYLQSWHQKKLSPISFGIAPTKAWNPDTGKHDTEVKRQAKLYVFCLLETKDQDKLDPMDLDQWVFYVLSRGTLDKNCSAQKQIGLNALLQLAPTICRFERLRDAVRECDGKD